MAKSNGAAANDAQASQPPFSAFMDFSRFMPNGVKVPGFDLEAVLQLQRRNAEALTQAGQCVLEGMQAVMRRQGEMAREGWQETASLFNGAMTPGSPEEKVAKQTEAAKSAIEKAVSNGRELADMLSKSQADAASAITARVTEALDELRAVCGTCQQSK